MSDYKEVNKKDNSNCSMQSNMTNHFFGNSVQVQFGIFLEDNLSFLKDDESSGENSLILFQQGTETSQSTCKEEDESNTNEKMIDLPSFNPKNSTPKDKTSLLPSKDKRIPDSLLSNLKADTPEHTDIIDASETEIQKDANSKDVFTSILDLYYDNSKTRDPSTEDSYMLGHAVLPASNRPNEASDSSAAKDKPLINSGLAANANGQPPHTFFEKELNTGISSSYTFGNQKKTQMLLSKPNFIMESNPYEVPPSLKTKFRNPMLHKHSSLTASAINHTTNS
jgi:hypothetical protein